MVKLKSISQLRNWDPRYHSKNEMNLQEEKCCLLEFFLFFYYYDNITYIR